MKYHFQKHYTREEATALLPQIRKWLEQLNGLREQLEKIEKRLGGLVAPEARASQVGADISITLGGVPRVWRGPCPHWIAAYGGMRTSIALPGFFFARSSRVVRTSSKIAGSCFMLIAFMRRFQRDAGKFLRVHSLMRRDLSRIGHRLRSDRRRWCRSL